MAIVLAHLLTAYAVLLAPWLGCWSFQLAQRRIAAGVPGAKLRFYRTIVAEQIATTAAVLFLCYSGRFSFAGLGVVSPHSWGLTLAILAIVVGLLVWSSLKLRPKADKLREKIKDRVGALLPDSLQERRWFGAISLGAGISEELLFRGFLLSYLGIYLPQLNLLEKVLLISLSFGIAHVYQGKLQIVSTGLLGLVLAGLYFMTGSLLLPILVHAAVDGRVLLIFPPPDAPTMALPSNS